MRKAWLQRIRPWVVALGLGAAAAASGQVAATSDAAVTTVSMETRVVAPDTYFVQGLTAMGSSANQNFISNAAFVVTGDGVIVIDSLGSPPLARQLLSLIRRVTPQPIRHVVLTHCHADHLYGLQVFKEAGARIVAHTGCRDYLQGETAQLRLAASREELFPWVDEHTRLVTPDVWLGDKGDEQDLVLKLGAREFRVRHVGPSHTVEDLVVFDPVTGALFAGDVVFRGRIPYVGQADSRRWISAMDRVLELQPRMLVPGHGPISNEPAVDLRLTRDYLAHLRKTMGDAARNLEPFDEAYARTDWSRFAGLPLFAAVNRMNAYNTYLLMEHEQP